MIKTRKTSLQLALRAADKKRLENGWLFLPSADAPTLDTACLIVTADVDDGDPAPAAAAEGFPQDGLDTYQIEDTTLRARQLEREPSDALLLESFIYYWRHDAWLPQANAPEPLEGDEATRMVDKIFFDCLGDERAGVPCKKDGCDRGAISQSVFCKAHHFEMIKAKPCPFA